MELLSRAFLKPQNKTELLFSFWLLIMSIQMLEWRQVVSFQYLEHNSYDVIEITTAIGSL